MKVWDEQKQAVEAQGRGVGEAVCRARFKNEPGNLREVADEL